MRLWIAALVSAAAFCAPAHADWFSRLDSDGKPVLTAIGTDENEVMRSMFLTCKQSHVVVTVATNTVAKTEDVASLKGGIIVFAFKDRNGARKQVESKSKAVAMPGRAVAVETELSDEQSQAVVGAISKGRRIDVEVRHSDLLKERDAMQFFALGYTQALLTLDEHCKELF